MVADTFYILYVTFMTLLTLSEKRIMEQIDLTGFYIIGTHLGNILYGREHNWESKFCVTEHHGAARRRCVVLSQGDAYESV